MINDLYSFYQPRTLFSIDLVMHVFIVFPVAESNLLFEIRETNSASSAHLRQSPQDYFHVVSFLVAARKLSLNVLV